MKGTYESPNVSVFSFETEDAVRTSQPIEGNDGSLVTKGDYSAGWW